MLIKMTRDRFGSLRMRHMEMKHHSARGAVDRVVVRVEYEYVKGVGCRRTNQGNRCQYFREAQRTPAEHSCVVQDRVPIAKSIPKSVRVSTHILFIEQDGVVEGCPTWCSSICRSKDVAETCGTMRNIIPKSIIWPSRKLCLP